MHTCSAVADAAVNQLFGVIMSSPKTFHGETNGRRSAVYERNLQKEIRYSIILCPIVDSIYVKYLS